MVAPDGHRVTTPRDPTINAWELEDTFCWICGKRMPGNLGLQVFIPSTSSRDVHHLVILHRECQP